MTETGEPITLTVNGEAQHVEPLPGQLLVELVRDQFGLKACHFGCLTGDCGACTLLVDEVPAKSCLLLAGSMDGHRVTTPEGDHSPVMRRLRTAFIAHNAFQCGFCTAGMLVAAADLLRRVSRPDADEIRWAIGGNLCRCTGYEPIVRAIQAASCEGDEA